MSDYPYPGIRPFRRDETDIFFGREKQADDLIDRLGTARFLAVVGASGCGKSSLVKTGMIAGLETGFLARAGAGWRVAEMRPGTAPFRHLAEGLAAAFHAADDGEAACRAPDEHDAVGNDSDFSESEHAEASGPSARSIEAVLRGGSLGLHKLLEQHPLPDGVNLLIVADQFEELFRYADNADASAEAAAFVSLLLAGSRPYPLPDGRISRRIYLVITMRSDFIGDCARFPGLAEAVTEGLYLTPRLTREQLREAVAEPPLVTGCDMEPALAARLLEDVEDDPDQLPLLQHVLQWMWLSRVESGDESPMLTLADYEQLGGFGKALSDRLDGIYNKLPPAKQAIAEILFKNLSKRDLEQRDIRRPVRLKQVAALAGVDPDDVESVVDAFRKESRNFITLSPNPDDPKDPLLDVCHESLLRQWKTLKDWLNDEAESGAMYRRLEEAALRWQNGGDLWRELELANALAWKEDFQPSPLWAKRYGRDAGVHFEAAMSFLEESRKAEQSALRKRRATFAFIIVFLIAVAGVLWFQLERTKKSETAALKAKKNAIQAEEKALKAKERTAIIEKERTRDLFESHFTHASLQAKIEDYAAAKKIIEQSRKIETDIPPARRHARDLLGWYANLMSGTADKVYEGAGVPLFKVAVSPDGKLLAAVGEKGTVVLFDAKTGKMVRRLEGHSNNVSSTSSVRSVVFHPEGKWLATAGDDKRILLWSIADGSIIREIETPDKIWGLALSPDGKLLASSGTDNNITIWNSEAGERIRTLKGHTRAVQNIAFSPDGTRLASASYDHTAIIWNVETGKMTHRLRGHAAHVVYVAFHPEGRILATCSSDRTVILWDVESGRPTSLLRGHENIVHGVAFDASGDRLISASSDRTIRIWDTDTGVTLKILQGSPLPISGLAVKDPALFSASNDGTLRKWSLGQDERMRGVDVAGAEPDSIDVSPDGKLVAVGFKEGPLRLYSLPNMDEIWKEEDAHSDRTHRIAFSPDSKTIATASFDNTVKLWRTEDGHLEQTFKGHTRSVHGIDFSPNGKYIATAGYDGKIGLFEIGREEGKLFEGHEGRVTSVMFDNGGKRLVSAGEDGSVQLWNVSLWPPKVIMDFPKTMDQVTWAAISPDGTCVAAVGRDALVHIFNATDGTEIHRFVGHENMIFRVAFSPDGEQVITMGGDGTVRVWDLESEERLFTIILPMNQQDPGPWDFSFRCTPTGCYIVVPLTRGKIVVYRMENFYGLNR